MQSAHRGVKAGGDRRGRWVGHPALYQERRALLKGECELLLDPPSALIGVLPDLRQLMPYVVGVQDADAVRDPAAHEIGARHQHGEHVRATPVVPDEIHRTADRLQLRDQPVAVPVDRRGEGVGDREAEARRGETDRLLVTKFAQAHDERIPDGRGLRIAVDQDGGHAPSGVVGCSTDSASAAVRRCSLATYSGSRIISRKARRLG